jgi:hypothetical protein
MIININGVDVEISKEEEDIFMESLPTYVPDKNYRVGKSTPWRRMTDDEAIAVSNAMKQQTVKNQMIYDAASYIDTSDELFGTLKSVLTALFSAKRADELLAPE